MSDLVSMEQLRAALQTFRAGAVDIVRLYTSRRCPHVSARDRRVIEAALGDISIDEALDVLDRIEREYGNTARPAIGPHHEEDRMDDQKTPTEGEDQGSTPNAPNAPSTSDDSQTGQGDAPAPSTPAPDGD